MNDDEEKEGERGCNSQMVEKVKNKRYEKHTFSSAGFLGSIRSATLVSRCSLIITGNNATLPKTLNAEQQGAKVPDKEQWYKKDRYPWTMQWIGLAVHLGNPCWRAQHI